jgi:ABC-type uncharacterized transport system substrate-binding protein
MVNPKAAFGLAAAVCFWFMAITSWAHPHVFINSTVEVVFDRKGLAGFRMRWLFDEIFSSMMRLDFDANHSGCFEDLEVKKIKQSAFASLRDLNYFTHVRINGKPFQVRYVTDFSADLNKGRLIYSFFVPCHVTAISTFKEIRLAVYDQSYYCSVFLEDPVRFSKAQPFQVTHSVATDKDQAYYYGQIYPEEITLRFRTDNG